MWEQIIVIGGNTASKKMTIKNSSTYYIILLPAQQPIVVVAVSLGRAPQTPFIGGTPDGWPTFKRPTMPSR